MANSDVKITIELPEIDEHKIKRIMKSVREDIEELEYYRAVLLMLHPEFEINMN